MYITKIDDLIDSVLYDFYATTISTDPNLSKILKEPNFVKYQKELNNLLESYSKKISLTNIQELVKSNDAIRTIFETLKRYLAFYLFLTIGFFYIGKNDTYINNIVEFSKNQPNYGYKIDHFFNSENNALVIKYNIMVRNILTLLTSDEAKIEIIKKKPDVREAILFLNQLGVEIIDRRFRLENLDNNVNDQAHNIITAIIFQLMYRSYERKEFFRILEMTENLEGEYMFIDIVVPTKRYVDFVTVENFIGKTETEKKMANIFWKFLTEFEQKLQEVAMSIDEKINLLIGSKIVYPICDDFMLYHKNSERYDRNIDPSQVKRKEDTKIRYLIHKIDSVVDLYSDLVKKDPELTKKIKRNFYIPLLNRKAILINHYEDLDIINKFLNQEKRSIENNEYFNDLMAFKSYPYINFKDFEKNGFSLILNKTHDVIRTISFQTQGDYKQNRKYHLQHRIGSKDMVINIVGFIRPTNLLPLHCLQVKHVIDIRTLDVKNKNGYDLFLRYLRASELGLKKHQSSVYWIFNLDTDLVSIDTYEQTTKSTLQDQAKHVASMLYDDILNELYYKIIDTFDKTEDLELQKAYQMLDELESKTLVIPKKLTIFESIENKIYQSIIKITPEYDKKEDIMFGLTGDVVKLPKYEFVDKSKVQLIQIDLTGISEYSKEVEKEKIEGICQHNITWDKISSLYKTDPSAYVTEMYYFNQQYVGENINHEYFCKSCGFQLSIKKFVIDGTFDDDKKSFITYSMPMDVPLEDIAEYEKYKIAIRNIDKLIEKIAIISNIPHLHGFSTTTRWRRKRVVKDVIDILIMNNQKLKNTFGERNKNKEALYNIGKDLSNLFVFTLENNVFVFSSKDKDQYKPIKQNNVVAYITFLMLLDTSDSQVTFMGGDKKGLCNFAFFDKIFYQLFGDLKIRINSKGELALITNYKILCYMIYITGCSIIKYNIWYYNYPDQTKKKKYIPIIQKIFVNTIVDVINSILENASLPDSHYLYEIISTKMFKKLNSTFSNEELYNRFKNEGKISIAGEKKGYILTKSEAVPLSGKHEFIKFENSFRIQCPTNTFKIPIYDEEAIRYKHFNYQKLDRVSNLTNCPSGEFHNWKLRKQTEGAKSHVYDPTDTDFICTVCGVKANEIEYDDVESKKIQQKFKYVRLQDLATRYCIIDGLFHQYIGTNKDENVCIKCNHSEKYIYSHEELDELEKKVEQAKEIKNKEDYELNEKIKEFKNEEISYNDKVVDFVIKAYNKSFDRENPFNFINELLDEIQTVIGDETGLGADTYLRANAYIIDHDHLGFPLEKNIVVTDKDNKIFMKSKHPFYKTDVIYYTSYKNKKIEIFYNAKTKILIGYKEENKNFVFNKKSDRKIIVNYSLFNKLRLMGYVSQIIDITDIYDDMILGRENLEIDKVLISNEIVNSIVRTRIDNLKRVIYDFEIIMYRIVNNYPDIISEEDDVYFASKFNSLVTKYRKQLYDIDLMDKNGKHLVFKHWKGVVRGITPQNLDSQQINIDVNEHKLINADIINKYDQNGNLVLYFIVVELSKLLKYNPTKATKLNIIYFIIEFINLMFDLFNEEKMMNNIDMKRFEYILKSVTYIQEVEESSGMKEIEGIYEELRDEDEDKDELLIKNKNEKMEDLREESEAIDMDGDYPYEANFDHSLDWQPEHQQYFDPNVQAD